MDCRFQNNQSGGIVMFRAVLSIVLILGFGLATSFAGDLETVSYKTLLSRNLTNLNRLSIGMTKQQVMDTMGSFQSKTANSVVPNPYISEPILVSGKTYEVFWYLTKKYPPFTPIKKSQATPVVLKDGVVIGWGDSFLASVKAGNAN
jgi:hypothetical protein